MLKKAFLDGELHEVYKQPPPGYSVPPGTVCHLGCSLYGLKRAPQTWFELFTSIVRKVGFKPSDHDPSLFLFTSLLMKCSSLVMTFNSLTLSSNASMRSSWCLIEDPFVNSLVLRSLLCLMASTSPRSRFRISYNALTDTCTANTPMELGVHLRPTDREPLDDPTWYHLVGCLIYLGMTS